MLVSFSVNRRDEALALSTLEWAHSLDGLLPYDCVLTVGEVTNREAIEAAARKLFRKVDVIEAHAPEAWPTGKNGAFQSLVRFLDGRRNKEPFLWLEPDSVPLKRGWLEVIEAEHRKGGKPFTGYVHPTLRYMECVGVYPPNFMDYSPRNGMLCRAAPWDIVAKDDIAPHAHAANHLFQMVHDIDGFPPTFEDKESLKLISKEAVLFHRNKDGTLVEQLSSGKWKRWFTFASRSKEAGVVTLRRAGDIISLLPAIKQMADERGKPVRMVIHESYQDLFDGVSYATPELWKGDWEDPLAAAQAHRAINAQVLGRNIMPDWKNGNFAKDAWKMLGREWNRYAPLIFDRRNEKREFALAERTFKTEKPKVLVKLAGFSSPFKDASTVLERLKVELSDACELVWLDDVKAERLYDLLGLMDRAACCASIDTVTLHLASGTTCPIIAFTNGNAFSATPPRGNCVLRMPYTDVLNRWAEVTATIRASLERTTDDRMALVYSYYQPKSEEGQKRNREAFSTWHHLPARFQPFVPKRDSRALGDPHGVPFVRDMIDAGFSSGDEGIVVLTNNDIQFTPELGNAIKTSCRKAGCYWAKRVPAIGEPTDGGIDIVAMTRSWWGLHRHQFPDLLMAFRHWDNAMHKLMRWTGGSEGARAYIHTPHLGVAGRLNSPGEAYNVKTARAWYQQWQERE